MTIPASPAVMRHPRDVLLGAQACSVVLPVCDHYCGTDQRIRKSLQMQADLMQEFGVCVMDVTLDCEDGAAVGREEAHAHHVADLLQQAAPGARVAVRVHPVDHPAFATDVAIIVSRAGQRLSHIMLPKVESATDVIRAVAVIDHAMRWTAERVPHHSQLSGWCRQLPVHVLLESSAAVHRAFEIAAHPRVQSVSFGLMDFVSTHAGAIPAVAMTALGQFEHPLVLRAKLEVAAACHAHGKTPSHCVVTEFRDEAALRHAAHRASHDLGYTRMWSIHPSQVRPILAALAPESEAIAEAAAILQAAQAAQWAPIDYQGVLHDRASYRYYWQLLERAYRTAAPLPDGVRHWFTPDPDSASASSPHHL